MAKKLVVAKVTFVDKKKKGSFRGFVNVKIGGLVSFSVSIVEGKKGLFVSYPSQKDGKGDYTSVVCPCSKEAHQYLNDIIMETWNAETEKAKPKTKNFEEDEEDLPFI